MQKVQKTNENSKYGIVEYSSSGEKTARNELLDLFKSAPMPDDQLMSNLGLFLNSKILARILFMHHIYQQIVNVPGVVFEFGTRWGQNLSLFSAFRGMYEPFNRHRKIVGFDTFTGFPSVAKEDGQSVMMKKGQLAVTDHYKEYLDQILDCQEKDNPLGHLKKHELRQGDATMEVEKYIKENPETIVALAYFDFDIYKPTKICLEAIKNRLVKGSVLAFDELNDPDSPGETLALMEVFGLQNVRLKRLPITSRTSYFVVE